jgi:class 3 adenylate cyclase
MGTTDPSEDADETIEGNNPATENVHLMQKHRIYLSVFIFGGMAFVLFAMLAFTTVRNVIRDKTLIMENALTQGYWIARSLEIGHSMMIRDHINALRDIIKEIEKNPDIRFLTILDASKQVLIAGDATLEGTLWPENLGTPPETGSIIKSDSGNMDLVFPAFFARAFQRMQHNHPRGVHSLNNAKWIILGLDASDAQAHYRDIVTQSVFVSVGMVILGLGAFFFFGMIQKYQLASASIKQLENIKQHLTRFVPGTVQKLIEENPERPMFNKVERDATVLFLDIDHYTKISADMSPEALNRLIEKYFSAFLDTILSYGGEINEKAGDAIMAIFTGKTRRAHALNAVKAATRIREQVGTLNHEKTPHEPAIQVNLGLNSGPVLLGATMIKGVVGERFTYTASGMVTNIASRLCDLGNNGEIHLSDTTAQLVTDQVKLEGPLDVHLKNIQDTVSVYKLQSLPVTLDRLN